MKCFLDVVCRCKKLRTEVSRERLDNLAEQRRLVYGYELSWGRGAVFPEGCPVGHTLFGEVVNRRWTGRSACIC